MRNLASFKTSLNFEPLAFENAAVTWKIEGMLVLITKRKLHMGFPLVPKWVTLNDLERRNGRVVCIISPNSVAYGPIR